MCSSDLAGVCSALLGGDDRVLRREHPSWPRHNLRGPAAWPRWRRESRLVQPKEMTGVEGLEPPTLGLEIL